MTMRSDNREPTRRFWLEAVAGHHSYDIEYRVRRRDGEYRWFKTRSVAIRDAANRMAEDLDRQLRNVLIVIRRADSSADP